MRHLLLLVLFALPAGLAAQEQSGRHFQRAPRTVPTPAASPAQDAAAHKGTPARIAPLRKLRSGRAWPSWHYTRQVTRQAPQSPSEATSGAPRLLHPSQKRGFWQRWTR